MEKSFNLTTDPWIKVIDKQTKQTQMISLIQLFESASQYSQLAGDMPSQDLSILRLLLAILHTVYSRVDADNQPYKWQDDPDFDDLLDTWETLYQQGQFTKAVTDYLKKHQTSFDFFGEHAFYQVTQADYDRFVPTEKQIKTGTGTVAIKQMNRLISESGNSINVFASASGNSKNQIELSELVRWLIMYENYTGVTDKTHIKTPKKFSNTGWVYGLNPVFVRGKNLFETLMLNLKLADDNNLSPQKPVWEYETIDEYIDERQKQVPPTNLAALYTLWSRLIHIEWSENNQPTIFSAVLPAFEKENVFIEPMTTWRKDKKASKNGADVFKPADKNSYNLGTAMWRNFGQYIGLDDKQTKIQPGIISWLQELKNDSLIDRDKPLNLVSIALVKDGIATSQMPMLEIYDDMTIKADVLFDTTKTGFWPQRIEDEITLTQNVAKAYWAFALDIGRIRSAASDTKGKLPPNASNYASHAEAKFYDQLNEPFKQWLASLTNEKDPETQITSWHNTLRNLTKNMAKQFLVTATPRDVRGIMLTGKDGKTHVLNVFTAENQLMAKLNKRLPVQKG